MKSVMRPVASTLALVGALAAPDSAFGQADDAAAGGSALETACASIEHSPIGAWTRHTATSAGTELDMRFALVTRAGATWYEILSTTAAGPSVLQLKVPEYPFTPAQIEEAVVKSGTSPAVRLPDAMIDDYRSSAAAGPLSDLRAECRKADVVGQEQIEVTAGTFDVTHLRFPTSGSEVWVSDEVPFGIVRGTIPGQGTMELAAHGSGATSSITETPVTLGTGGAGAAGDP